MEDRYMIIYPILLLVVLIFGALFIYDAILTNKAIRKEKREAKLKELEIKKQSEVIEGLKLEIKEKISNLKDDKRVLTLVNGYGTISTSMGIDSSLVTRSYIDNMINRKEEYEITGHKIIVGNRVTITLVNGHREKTDYMFEIDQDFIDTLNIYPIDKINQNSVLIVKYILDNNVVKGLKTPTWLKVIELKEGFEKSIDTIEEGVFESERILSISKKRYRELESKLEGLNKVIDKQVGQYELAIETLSKKVDVSLVKRLMDLKNVFTEFKHKYDEEYQELNRELIEKEETVHTLEGKLQYVLQQAQTDKANLQKKYDRELKKLFK